MSMNILAISSEAYFGNIQAGSATTRRRLLEGTAGTSVDYVSKAVLLAGVPTAEPPISVSGRRASVNLGALNPNQLYHFAIKGKEFAVMKDDRGVGRLYRVK